MKFEYVTWRYTIITVQHVYTILGWFVKNFNEISCVTLKFHQGVRTGGVVLFNPLKPNPPLIHVIASHDVYEWSAIQVVVTITWYFLMLCICSLVGSVDDMVTIVLLLILACWSCCLITSDRGGGGGGADCLSVTAEPFWNKIFIYN